MSTHEDHIKEIMKCKAHVFVDWFHLPCCPFCEAYYISEEEERKDIECPYCCGIGSMATAGKNVIFRDSHTLWERKDEEGLNNLLEYCNAMYARIRIITYIQDLKEKHGI